MADDYLSDLVQAVALKGTWYYRFEGGECFSVRMPAVARRMCFHIVLDGSASFEVDGADPVRVHQGDVVLLNRGTVHRLSDQPGRTAVDIGDAKREANFQPGLPLRVGRGDPSVVLLCGEFAFSDTLHPIFNMLPNLLHVPASDSENVAVALRLVDLESGLPRLGTQAIIDRLSEVILVQIVRDWIDAHLDVAYLRAYRDPQIGTVVSAVQATPGRAWTVESLARVAGMSRTSFAVRFRELMGCPPKRYVNDWRMRLARSLLQNPAIPLADVGEQVGYASQAAFAKAFRDHNGVPPGKFRALVHETEGA